MRTVIIVTGTPGTGKTTFSRALAKLIGANYVNITQYVAKRKLYSRIDRERKTKVINLVRTRASLKNQLKQEGGFTIIDTHIPAGIVPGDLVRWVLVLRCHPRVLESRLRVKKWKHAKIGENVLAEVIDSCLIDAVKQHGWKKVVQIDTSHQNLQESTAQAKKVILGKPTRRVKIDWLSTLEKEGVLERYLK